MAGLAKVQDDLAAEGIGIAGISVDPAADSAPLAERLGVTFPLLSDPELSAIAAYGVQMQGEALAVPATFVVRQDKTIAWTYVGESTPDRPAVDVVREEVARAKGE